MLKHLYVQNYALIDELELDFKEELTVITGETGAGKSILLGALSLLLGQRADTSALQDKTKKCIVEANFNIKNYNLRSFFDANNLDYQDTSIIRREINPAGTSRAFINDTPVNLNQLKEIGVQLIDIHSQHQTLSLNDAAFQLDIIDSFAKNEKLLEEYQKDFRHFKKLKQELDVLTEKEKQSQKESDYYTFQYKELEEAALKEGEQQKLEQELEVINNAEEIKTNLAKVTYLIKEGEVNILSAVAEAKTLLNNLSKYDATIKEFHERIQNAYIEIKDICDDIENMEEHLSYNASRAEEINNRLSLLYKLQQKHQLKTVEELIELKNKIQAQLKEIEFLGEKINEKKVEIEIAEKNLEHIAKNLSANRTIAIPKIERELKTLLTQLEMPNAVLQIEKNVLPDFDLNGKDDIKFLFSANKGALPKELKKVASGGELSRLMLSLKSLLAHSKALPTIIFDEIDTGVSGEVANKVGTIMQQMAASMQVISITHLPQIASKGNTHLYIYKEEKEHKTISRIKKLLKEERVIEIAKMLSTKNPSQAALKNAKELLAN